MATQPPATNERQTDMSNNVTVQAPGKQKEADISKVLGGSDHEGYNLIVVNQVANTLWLGHASEEERDKLITGAMIALQGIAPSDKMEGMLAGQMIATHNATMECFRRAMLQGQTFAGRHEALKQASKLSRAYIKLMEALNKKRGKGGQKVTVKHVHVHEGGQAIVGNVEHTTKPIPGGGEKIKTKEQPHAKQK